MAGYINLSGKILAAELAVAVATQAMTGKDTGVARGCLAGLVAWMCWCTLVLGTLYFLIFG